jgi:hypothetical protein
MTNEDTGLPSVQFRPWGQGTQGPPADTNQASAYLDGEWLRLIANLGYSQMWATGGNAGALEGSEINLTQDDRADIAEFSVISPVLKEILKRLAELGIMQAVGVPEEEISILLSKNYEMVSWLTWEYNDKAALQQEQLENQMEMEKGKSDDRNSYDKSNKKSDVVLRYNEAVHERFIHCVLNQESMPMTPVASSWIKAIGYEQGSIYMQVPKQDQRASIFEGLSKLVNIISTTYSTQVEGKTIYNFMNELYSNKSIVEASLDFIRDEDGGVMIRFKLKNESKSVIPIFKQDYVCPSSDGVLETKKNTHPH